MGLLSNRPLVAAESLGVGIMACISYLPALQQCSIPPLTVSDWLMLIVFGALLLAAEEARKAVVRARKRRYGRSGTGQDAEAPCKS